MIQQILETNDKAEIINAAEETENVFFVVYKVGGKLAGLLILDEEYTEVYNNTPSIRNRIKYEMSQVLSFEFQTSCFVSGFESDKVEFRRLFVGE